MGLSSLIVVGVIGLGGYLATHLPSQSSGAKISVPRVTIKSSLKAQVGTNDNPIPGQSSSTVTGVPKNANIGTPQLQGYSHKPKPGIARTYPPVVPRGSALTSIGIQTVGLVHFILNHDEVYATQFLIGSGRSVRVIARDGQSVTPLSSFSDQNRVNLFVEKNLVVSATIG